MEKSPEAFRTISEVADWLDTPAHVLRFWESRFPEIAPVKRAGGRRYYRPQDMQLLGGIKHLLHTEGHTIKSVQERLKSGGTGAICAFSPPLATGPAEVEDAAEADSLPAMNGHAEASGDPARVGPDSLHGGDHDLTGDPAGAAGAADFAADEGIGPVPAHADSDPGAADEDLPPIGFFFDDSDDAAPAEDQSGTFAALAPDPFEPLANAEDDFPEPEDEPGSAAAPEAPGPLADLSGDVADGAALGAPVVPMASELRGLTRRDLPPGWREKLPGIIRRLDRLCRDDR